MSRDSKDEGDDDGGDLKALLQKARQGPINFGFCLGGKPEETVLNLHRKKSPDILEREAKKSGSSPKTAGGTVTVQGANAMLTCTGDPPAGSAKKLSTFLKKVVGLKLRVVILDAEGNELESGDVEDGEDVEEEAASQEPAPPGDASAPVAEDIAAKYDAELKRLVPAVQAAITANPAARDVLLKLVQLVRAAAQAGNAAEARTRLEQITMALSKLGAAAGGQGQDGKRLSLVKLGKARIEWADTRLAGIAGIQRLKVAIERDYADMPEAASAVKSAADRLDRTIGTLNAALQDQLDLVLNAEGPAREAEAERARQLMKAFGTFVDADPVMAALDGNEILPELAVTGPLRAKLAEIAAALG